MLAPFRAFGDFKFKWSKETITDTLGSVLGPNSVPPHYKTPPYLTAAPEVTTMQLTPRDKFVVLGSDGLWDMMTPMQVMNGKMETHLEIAGYLPLARIFFSRISIKF